VTKFKLSIISANLSGVECLQHNDYLAHIKSIAEKFNGDIEHIIIKPKELEDAQYSGRALVKFISGSNFSLAQSLNQAVNLSGGNIFGFVDICKSFESSTISQIDKLIGDNQVVAVGKFGINTTKFNHLKYWSGNAQYSLSALFVSKDILGLIKFDDLTLFDQTFGNQTFLDLLFRLQHFKNVNFIPCEQKEAQVDTYLARRLFRKFEKLNCGFENRFSFVLPVQEYSMQLEEFIASIEAQNFCDIEVVVVGMCVDDRSLQKKLKNFEDTLRKTAIRYVGTNVANYNNAVRVGIDFARSAFVCATSNIATKPADYVLRAINKFENDSVAAVLVSDSEVIVRKFAFDDCRLTFSNDKFAINQMLNKFLENSWKILEGGVDG
jgi:hypothetical protein